MTHEQALNPWAIGVAITLMASTASAVAFAQTADSPTPAPAAAPAMSALYACAAITDNAERLACYDRTVASVRASEASGDLVTLDRAQVEAVERDAFGFQMPSLPRLFRRAEAATPRTAEPGAPATARPAIEEPASSQTYTIVRITRRGDGQLLTTSTGQSWQLVEPTTIRGAQATPLTVTIRRAAMGSFILQVDGRNQGYRVRRVD
jgi:hypothetical protein